MQFVDNNNINDPRVNLAIEEHLLRNWDTAESILLFYINEPAVIIGRNQNTLEEIDPDFVREKGIHVVRRLSGGGAVYHDLGNLNFSFITPDKKGLHKFAKFTDPVIRVLERLGIEAELSGKSDIFAAGKKISGNAQYAASGRMFSHGTLLFDTDLEVMLKALNPRQVQIESKAVQSIRNFVINIRELLPQDMTVQELRAAILSGLFEGGEITSLPLVAADWRQINQISADRYRQWEWNFGRSPKFNIQKSERFPAGKIDVRIDVANGRIQTIKFYGDFSGRHDVAELEEHLVDVRYEPSALVEALKECDIQLYLGELATSELVDLLY
jgi:lipoate-protein ligase A